MKKPEIKYTLEIFPEEMEIRGNASAIDAETDERIACMIEKQLAEGNPWAWCCVKVTAECEGFTGTDCLGGCSYASQAEFCDNDGYYNDMKEQALEDLRAKLNHAAERGSRAAEILHALNA